MPPRGAVWSKKVLKVEEDFPGEAQYIIELVQLSTRADRTIQGSQGDP